MPGGQFPVNNHEAQLILTQLLNLSTLPGFLQAGIIQDLSAGLASVFALQSQLADVMAPYPRGGSQRWRGVTPRRKKEFPPIATADLPLFTVTNSPKTSSTTIGSLLDCEYKTGNMLIDRVSELVSLLMVQLPHTCAYCISIAFYSRSPDPLPCIEKISWGCCKAIVSKLPHRISRRRRISWRRRSCWCAGSRVGNICHKWIRPPTVLAGNCTGIPVWYGERWKGILGLSLWYELWKVHEHAFTLDPTESY